MNRTNVKLIGFLLLTTPAAAQTWIEEAQLYSDAPVSGERFGDSVAIDGDTALVGAEPGSGSTDGGAWVFVRSGYAWSLQATLLPSGWTTVSIEGDTALVGMPGDDHKAPDAGAASVFVRSGTSWILQARIFAPDAALMDEFGSSVSLSVDTALIGARGDDQGGSTYGGSAYVFVRNGSTWTQQAKLLAGDTTDYDWFGYTVALEGDTAVVAAPWNDNPVTWAGSVYVFVRSGGSWTQQAKLIASDAGHDNVFGFSLALSGDRLLVGAPYHDGPGLMWSGAVYEFGRSGTAWSQAAKMTAIDAADEYCFGDSVALDGDLALIGAGGPGYYYYDLAGCAYSYEREGRDWVLRQKLEETSVQDGEHYGHSVALSGDLGVIGTPSSHDNGSYSGKVFAYHHRLPPGTGTCFGDPGSGTPCPCNNDNDGSVPGSGCDNGIFPSGAKLEGSGIASVAHDSLVLTTTHQEPFNTGLYFQAKNDLSPGVVWGNGLRCAGRGETRLQVRTADIDGTSFTTVALGAKGGVVAGDTRFYQLWYRSTVYPPCGFGSNEFNTTNGYRITWKP